MSGNPQVDKMDIFYENLYVCIPTGIPAEMVPILRQWCESRESELENSTIGGQNLDPKIRNSQHVWLPSDGWVSGLMAHLVRCANDIIYNYDLTNWASGIQYTVYDGSSTGYSWHTDSSPSASNPKEIRKLSISLLLSSPDEYEGGELQMHNGRESVLLKPEMGHAIVFPSTTPHRVRRLKGGVRRSLVGWMGGPAWR